MITGRLTPCLLLFVLLPTTTNAATLIHLLHHGHRYTHGCNVLYDLVKPWANTNTIVVADSYFASVQSALRLKSIGLRFIGVVKTAHKEFPMNYLSRYEMPGGRGDRKALHSHDSASATDLLAFVWVDRERRYFITTCSSVAPGPYCKRFRWRQVDPLPAPAKRVEILIDQPLACSIYYGACGKIDQHNRLRQQSLELERKVKTHMWDRRVNLSIFAMVVCDAYLLAAGCQGVKVGEPRFFFELLAEQLIDNTYEERALRKRAARATGITIDDRVELDPTDHLTFPTPTKRKKKNNPKHTDQGRCMVCSRTSTHVCRECQRKQPYPEDKQYWICNRAGKVCMGVHILNSHPDKNARNFQPEVEQLEDDWNDNCL